MRTRSQGWSWPYCSLTKMTQANSSTWRISSTSTRNGFISQRIIIAADEAEHYRHVQHKSFLTKIMFLCAVARPRYNMSKNTWFDGKIGIWPIGKWEPVKRSSKKCAKGMPVWKNQSITQDVYWEYLIQKLLPAI